MFDLESNNDTSKVQPPTNNKDHTPVLGHVNHQRDHQCDIPDLCQSSQVTQPSNASLQSAEYQQRESDGREERQDWATNTKASITVDHHKDDHDIIACLSDTKMSHHIPHSFKHAIATDPD